MLENCSASQSHNLNHLFSHTTKQSNQPTTWQVKHEPIGSSFFFKWLLYLRRLTCVRSFIVMDDFFCQKGDTTQQIVNNITSSSWLTSTLSMNDCELYFHILCHPSIHPNAFRFVLPSFLSVTKRRKFCCSFCVGWQKMRNYIVATGWSIWGIFWNGYCNHIPSEFSLRKRRISTLRQSFIWLSELCYLCELVRRQCGRCLLFNTPSHGATQCLFLLKVAAETVAVAAAETGWQLSQSLPCFVNQFSSSPLNFSITQTTHVLFEVRLLHILIRIRPLDFRFLMAFSMYVNMHITFDWCRTLQQTITSKKAVTSHPCCEYFHFFFSPTHTHALTPSLFFSLCTFQLWPTLPLLRLFISSSSSS